MMSCTQMLTIFVLVVAFTNSAYCMRCYACQSDGSVNSKCGENFNPEGLLDIDCSRTGMPRFLQQYIGSRNATGCMKVTTEVNNMKIISRSCYFGDVSDTSKGCMQDPSLNIFNKQISCHVCTSDLCNSATGIAPTTVIAFLCAFLVYRFSI